MRDMRTISSSLRAGVASVLLGSVLSACTMSFAPQNVAPTQRDLGFIGYQRFYVTGLRALEALFSCCLYGSCLAVVTGGAISEAI